MTSNEQVVEKSGSGALRALVQSMRISQWAKNVFIFIPLFTAHQWRDPDRVAAAGIVFLIFSVVASGTYLVNDLVDVEADRLHPRKRHRPIAAGRVSPRIASIAAAGLVLGGISASLLFSSTESTTLLLVYLVATLAYSSILKTKMLLDVIVLAGLYTLRLFAGGVAADVPISPWLLAFSSFLFVSLALVKRYSELLQTRAAGGHALSRRAYSTDDLEAIFTMGVISAYLSILVLCLYVSSPAVSQLYARAGILWAICPVMLYWVSRVWLLARREELGDDPVAFAIGDATSYGCVGLMALIAAAAAW